MQRQFDQPDDAEIAANLRQAMELTELRISSASVGAATG